MLLARPNSFVVDLQAIARNAGAIRRIVGPSCTIFAALKADAFGYGITKVAPILLSAGVDAISLVSLQDAVKLRQSGTEAPILLYGGVLITPRVIAALEQYDLMPTVLDVATARTASSLAREARKVFVKIDVGLERLGIAPAEAVDFLTAISAMPRLKVHGVYAHMHVRGDRRVSPYLKWQFDRFTKTVEQLNRAGFLIPIAMTASTRVLEATSSEMNLNAVDPGRVFFGLAG
jgi:alanine racemase